MWKEERKSRVGEEIRERDRKGKKMVDEWNKNRTKKIK